MNRAEFRRMKKEAAKKQNVYTMTQEQLDAQCQIRDLSTMHTTMISTVGILLLCLRDVYGFGPVRIKRLMDSFMSRYECVVEDIENHELASVEKFDFLAIIRQLKKETGYDLTALLERDVYGNIWLRQRKK
jgi:hypothetical protein